MLSSANNSKYTIEKNKYFTWVNSICVGRVHWCKNGKPFYCYVTEDIKLHQNNETYILCTSRKKNASRLRNLTMKLNQPAINWMDKPGWGVDQSEIWYLDLIREHDLNHVWPGEIRLFLVELVPPIRFNFFIQNLILLFKFILVILPFKWIFCGLKLSVLSDHKVQFLNIVSTI